MRIIVIILCLIQLGFIAFQVVTKGLPDSDEILIVLVISALPVVSLIFLYTNHLYTNQESFLSVLLKRKILEEKVKIEKLQKAKDSSEN